MAIYHLRLKVISRGLGRAAKPGGATRRSIVAAAAYRSGEKLYDEAQGKWFDYQKPDVVHTEIMVPEGVYDSEKTLTASSTQQSRTELIQKLGTVSDLLRVHAQEKDDAELRQIEYDVARALRDLMSRYTLEQLSAAFHGDASLKVIVPLVVDALVANGLERLPETQVVTAAWLVSPASIA